MGLLQPYERRDRLTLRSVVIGLVFAQFVNWLIMVSVYRLRSSWLVFGHFPVAVMLPFVVLALVVNVALRRWTPRLALSRTELLVILSMGLVAAVIPEFRLTGYFISVITAPVYFASPENRWNEVLVPILPRWLIPSNEHGAVTYFYNGLPAGMPVPWHAWAGPVFWWTSLFVALFVVTSALVVVFRKPWEEHERLVFPLAKVPLAMVAEGGRRGLPAVFARPGFWIAAAAPLLIVLWNAVGWWHPGWPHIPLMDEHYSRIYLGEGPAFLRIRLNPFVMAFVFFARRDILFSIWFFVVLATLQLAVYERIGFMSGEVHPFVRESPIGWQAFGALTILVFASIWTARRHLGRVFASVVRRRGRADDANEFMSYPAAVGCIVLGLAYIVTWLIRAGLTPGATALYVAAYLVLTIGVTKIIAQCGLVLARAPMTAQNFTMFTLGTKGFPAPTMGAFALCFAFICDGNPYLMPQVSHAGKLTAHLGRRKRLLFWAIALTALTVFLASVIFSLSIGYERGAQNCSPSAMSGSAWLFEKYAQLVPEEARIRSDPRRLTCFGVGAAVGLALILVRARFAWWPLHPAGLALCQSTAIKYSFFPVFMAWLIKTIILRIGGHRLHERAAPVMVGLIAGYVLGVGVGLLIDALWFPGRGHGIHGW